jgi:hypothetical protein
MRFSPERQAAKIDMAATSLQATAELPPPSLRLVA